MLESDTRNCIFGNWVTVRTCEKQTTNIFEISGKKIDAKNANEYIMKDSEVKLNGYLFKKKYPESFRLVRYYDEKNDREFTFLTNAK